MSLISSAILGLKHHSQDKTIYLGHGSLASSTRKLPSRWSIYLHALLSFTLSRSASLPHSRAASILFRKPLRWTVADCWHSCPQAVWMEVGFMGVLNDRGGVLKLFGLTLTGTLMISGVKYHLTSSTQLASLNYSECELLVPSNRATIERLLKIILQNMTRATASIRACFTAFWNKTL